MASSEGRAAKYAKLQSLRQRLPFISQSALAEVLKANQAQPLPDAASRRTIGRARDFSAAQPTPYGQMHKQIALPRVTGEPLLLEVQNPFATLWMACKHSAAFSGVVRRAAPPSKDTPWRVVLYLDEVLPGNQLAYKSTRKLMACYWSVLDFGGAALAHEDACTPMAKSIAECRSAACGLLFFLTRT